MNDKVNFEIAKIKSLMERINKPLTPYQTILNESNYINEAKWKNGLAKRVSSPNEFFDILTQIKNGWYVSVGYVTAAKLNLPKVKRKNPVTNRMKGYEDYEGLGETLGSEMSGLMRFTRYNFHWQDPSKVGASYAKYKENANNIRTKYGVPPIGNKENDYKDKMNYGGGIHTYGGNNPEKQENVYVAQNLHGAEVESIYYSIDQNGNILNSFTHDEIKAYLLKTDPVTRDSGALALKKMGKDADTIKHYLEEIDGLNMKYRALVDSGLLFLRASLAEENNQTVDINQVIYINPKLQKTANDINVNPSDFEQLVLDFYEGQIKNIHKRKRNQS